MLRWVLTPILYLKPSHFSKYSKGLSEYSQCQWCNATHCCAIRSIVWPALPPQWTSSCCTIVQIKTPLRNHNISIKEPKSSYSYFEFGRIMSQWNTNYRTILDDDIGKVFIKHSILYELYPPMRIQEMMTKDSWSNCCKILLKHYVLKV